MLGVYDDITERKAAVEALRQSEHKFHSLYSAMTEGVALHELVFDADGRPVDYRLLDVNPAFETILGITRQMSVGRCASEVYGEAPFLDQFAEVALSGTPLRFQPHFAPMDRIFSISVFSPGKNQFAPVFKDVTAVQLARRVTQELLARTSLDGGLVDEVAFGQVVASVLAPNESNGLNPIHLINTHCHIDHILGNKFISESYNLPLTAHKKEKQVLDFGTQTAIMYQIPYEISPEITKFIDEGDAITFGNTKLDVLFTPGHSPASISLYCKSANILIAGDVLFQRSIGRTDLPGGNFETLTRNIQS